LQSSFRMTQTRQSRRGRARTPEALPKSKLPEWPDIQVQGLGTVEAHHGVAGTMEPCITTREWHTDGMHELACPPVLTSMYAIEVPPVAGDTLFASGYDAWDALAPTERERLGNALVHYKMHPNKISADGTLAEILDTTSSDESNVRNGPAAVSGGDSREPDGGGVGQAHAGAAVQAHARAAPVAHPIFRRHPNTDRVALSVAPLFTFMSSVEIARAVKCAARVDGVVAGCGLCSAGERRAERGALRAAAGGWPPKSRAKSKEAR